MSRPRDTQRSKLYAAERRAFGRSTAELPAVADVQAYVDKVVGTAWWIARWGFDPVRVADGRGSSSARCISTTGIAMPVDMRSKWVVLHELAHVVTQRQYGWNVVPWHGWEFCDNYLAIVRHYLGADAADRLRAEMRAGRVRYTKPRQGRPLTPEQRAAAVARLAAYRANAASKDPS